MKFSSEKIVGKGGMGEILLVYDPVCERHIALKRIREELRGHEVIKNRFLREATITAQLTHPGIISIYSIHHEGDELYYTMPYVEGETLRKQLKRPIPALLHIFKSVCQTIAYAHSQGVIHRDLKPENILVGKYGEVIILDWGLAQMMAEPSEELDVEATSSDPGLTVPGKLVGTVAYMAPERALGAPATVQTDVYALGVILYQILTLHLPFNRGSVKEFCKTYKYEKLIDPEEVAPYREVPPRLSRMVRMCLDPDPAKRYQSVDELIHDLTSHMEGRSEWFESASLDPRLKRDWEFQENVLVSKHMALTQTTEAADWVSIMVSKGAFADNTRIETRVHIGESGEGIGFLLNVPEAQERENPLEGYCLWMGSDLAPSLQLFRNTVEVMQQNEISLKRGEWHEIAIEQVDHNIHFYLNGILEATYLSYLPLFGTHIGILAKDADFEMEPLKILSGSQNLTVSCLSIPDAFLASRDYKRALAEYRRIGYSFPGHAEGREALFRAGVTLLEQARTSRTEKKTEEFYTLALEEFAKLHKTPGAPLEYLGKALVYQSLRDNTEEIKCLELGLRRYRKHPLIDAIVEQIVYRMHETAQNDRRSAYQLILIVLRLLPDVASHTDSQRLFTHLTTHWEPLPFFESPDGFTTPLAFWLGAPYILLETYQELIKSETLDVTALGDLIFALFELGSYGLAHKLMEELKTHEAPDLPEMLNHLRPIYTCHKESLQAAINEGAHTFRTLCYLIQFALRTDQEEYVHTLIAAFDDEPLSREEQITLDAYDIWAYLKESNIKKVEELFDKYPYEMLNQEGTLLHPLYGCFLYMTEGEEIAMIHFAGVIDTPFPRSWALLGHELSNKITESVAWYSTSFLWERRQLYRQMTLFYQCTDNPDMEAYYKHLEREEYIYVPE